MADNANNGQAVEAASGNKVTMIQHSGGKPMAKVYPVGTTLAQIIDDCGAGSLKDYTFTVINQTGAQTQVRTPAQAAATIPEGNTRVVQTPNNLAGA